MNLTKEFLMQKIAGIGSRFKIFKKIYKYKISRIDIKRWL